MQDSFFIVCNLAAQLSECFDMTERRGLMICEYMGRFLHSCWDKTTIRYRNLL